MPVSRWNERCHSSALRPLPGRPPGDQGRAGHRRRGSL